MGRAPCCDKTNVKRGPWSPEEDAKLKEFIEKYGTGGNWIALPQKAGLKRCGKSCRLRWLNYLRPNIKHGDFSDHEDRIICSLYASIGSRWSIIAAQLPGRTDNDIKNYWNTKLKKKLMAMFSTNQQRKFPPFSSNLMQSPPPLQAQPISNLSQFLRDCTPYSSHIKSFSGHESISFSSANLVCNNDNITFPTNQSIFQMQEGLMSTPSQYYPLKDNMLMFGSSTDQASCSSSDGSFCSQISSYSSNKEIKQESMNTTTTTTCLQGGGYNISSNGYEQQQQKQFMLDYGNNGGSDTWSNNQKQAGIFGEFQLEEAKQLLISSYSNVCNDSSFWLMNDENKTREKSMYFY